VENYSFGKEEVYQTKMKIDQNNLVIKSRVGYVRRAEIRARARARAERRGVERQVLVELTNIINLL
jgi:hypothetical protein